MNIYKSITSLLYLDDQINDIHKDKQDKCNKVSLTCVYVYKKDSKYTQKLYNSIFTWRMLGDAWILKLSPLD